MELTKISKKLSYMLRHSTGPLYIDLNGGWADVNIIIKALREKFSQVNRSVLDEIVANDEKGRYSYNADKTKIRANQGHSIPGVIIELHLSARSQLLRRKVKKDTGIKDSILKSTIFLSLQRSMIVSCASITAVIIMMAR